MTAQGDFSQLGQRIDEAQAKAEAAEDYAADAINFAIAAVQEAEYAVLDAVLAHSAADTLTAS